MLKNISLSFFKENFLDESEFMKEILSTTLREFKVLMKQFQLLDSKPDTFNSEEFYQIMHKYKPTVSMFKMKTYPHYLKYGSGNRTMDYTTYQEISNELKSNLEGAIIDLEKEMQKYQ